MHWKKVLPARARKRPADQRSTRVDTAYLPELGGTYLEDSYFLGLTAEGKNLRLKMLLALTAEHPAYSPPKIGEQHCYRTGSILIEYPRINGWKCGDQSVTRDPDGTFDFGGIVIYRTGTNDYRIVTEWFEISVTSPNLSIEMD